jgi:MSHA pilin protein MshD
MPATKRISRGFTLIELVVGIVVFAIVLTLVTTLLFPQAGRSVDPIMQVRATELAQSFFNEIQSKRFDENGDSNVRCNEDINTDGDLDDISLGEAACTAAVNFGPDSESRSDFDDVDDYHGFAQGVGTADSIIQNSLAESIQVGGTNLYEGFTINITVMYDGDLNGIADADQSVKRVGIIVTLPNQEQIQFATYRRNF